MGGGGKKNNEITNKARASVQKEQEEQSLPVNPGSALVLYQHTSLYKRLLLNSVKRETLTLSLKTDVWGVLRAVNCFFACTFKKKKLV